MTRNGTTASGNHHRKMVASQHQNIPDINMPPQFSSLTTDFYIKQGKRTILTITGGSSIPFRTKKHIWCSKSKAESTAWLQIQRKKKHHWVVLFEETSFSYSPCWYTWVRKHLVWTLDRVHNRYFIFTQ